jgi:Mg2+ and Co2+ transporter CorA
MIVNVWDGERLRQSSVNNLSTEFDHPTWIDLAETNEEDLQQVAEVIQIPGQLITGRSRAIYLHADRFPQYMKIPASYPTMSTTMTNFQFRRIPVLILLSQESVLTIFSSATDIRNRISEEFTKKSLPNVSIPAQVTFFTLLHLMETHEKCADTFEAFSEKCEESYPRWSRQMFSDVFNIWKGATRSLRILNRFKTLVESIAKGTVRIPFKQQERELFELIYDRAEAAEDTVEMAQQTLKELMDMRLDDISHETNMAMRLMAAITCIVAIPSVIGALLGMNLLGMPWPWPLWQVALIGILPAVLMAAYFYMKGWLGGSKGLYLERA